VLNRVKKSSDLLDTSMVLGAGGMLMRVKPNHEYGFIDPTFLFATEHLLLAVSLSEDNLGVGQWLRDQGFEPAAIYTKIETQYSFREPVSSQESVAGQGNESESAQDQNTVSDNLTPIQTLSRGNSINNSESNGKDRKLEKKSCRLENINSTFENRESKESACSTLAETNGVTEPNLLRLLDASANRAQEAIRVIEDYVRFVLDDSYLTTLLKEFRHEFSSLIRELPIRDRLVCRDTESDVGTTITGQNEYCRESLCDVLASNFSRLQESLRSLEEFTKVISVKLAQGLEQLRYRSYTLHKVVSLTDVSSSRLKDAAVYVLTDCRDSESEFVQLIRTLVLAGADVIQLRDKHVDDKTLLEYAKTLRKLTAGTKTLFIMNDRPDIAKISGADGVHLGQDELPIREVRAFLLSGSGSGKGSSDTKNGANMLIGLSTHNIDQARKAVLDGADYIGVGPVFPSSTKNFTDFPGTEFLREVADELAVPAFAIGGITLENVQLVVDAGIKRVAVGSAVLDALDPGVVVAEFRNMLSNNKM
ncbi:MAG: thiamine phosphate synthase, partial [Thermoguttaceae bacterium]